MSLRIPNTQRSLMMMVKEMTTTKMKMTVLHRVDADEVEDESESRFGRVYTIVWVVLV